MIEKDGMLSVDIEDNVTGIDESKLNEIVDNLDEEDEYCENVGIRNVYKYLRVYYGTEVKFSIKSEMNIGNTAHYEINLNSRN